MQAGYSSRLSYDNNVYREKLENSTYPLGYRVNPNQMYNKDKCMSLFGPRGGYTGISVPTKLGYAESQDLIDLDSVFSNRNVNLSKARTAQVNPINPVTEFKLYDTKVCNNKLDPMYSRDDYPASNYRDVEINRFYNLNRNPQAHLFTDFAVNSRLEARDNFRPCIPTPWDELALPIPAPDVAFEQCTTNCNVLKQCPKVYNRFIQ